MLKEKIETILRDRCNFDVRKETSEDYEFYSVVASDEILKQEAA